VRAIILGTGTGAVVSQDQLINCTATCSRTFDYGTRQVLAATPGGGSTFSGWSGACSGTGACVITANADVTVTAVFMNGSGNSLVVSKSGTGSGTVTSVPARINCGSDCLAIFPTGSHIPMAATPQAGSSFDGWSGACSGTGPCVAIMNGDKALTATFTQNVCSYTVTPSSKGFGALAGSLTVTIHGTGAADCPKPAVSTGAD
jgi:hypothetical protein